MTTASIASFVLLFGYLAIMAWKNGIPDMVSDTFYQLGKKHGWIFSAVLTVCALTMMVVLLDSGLGFQPAAFIGTAGVVFVAFAPNYLSQDEYTVHKSAATASAMACTAWCLSVCIWPTIIIAAAYLLYLSALNVKKSLWGVWWVAPLQEPWHPWYWAEAACFADVFITYWTSFL